jgi:hypothetical protein
VSVELPRKGGIDGAASSGWCRVFKMINGARVRCCAWCFGTSALSCVIKATYSYPGYSRYGGSGRSVQLVWYCTHGIPHPDLLICSSIPETDCTISCRSHGYLGRRPRRTPCLRHKPDCTGHGLESSRRLRVARGTGFADLEISLLLVLLVVVWSCKLPAKLPACRLQTPLCAPGPSTRGA